MRQGKPPRPWRVLNLQAAGEEGSRAIAVRARDSAWCSGEFRRLGPSLVKVETSDQQWLSMDYQVFLLSRITERYDQTGDTTDAVTFGVSSTARIITGAALIIVAVFTGFAAGEPVMFQQMGLGVAIALLIDATIVRSVLVPATMKLLGKRNWYLPSWLTWLPDVHVEGAKPLQPATQAHRP
jgi:hypothetical protein